MEKHYTINKKKKKKRKRPVTDCSTDHKLLIAKFGLKLKWEDPRPFRYDLNQIPFDYTGEVMNRFKELNIVDRVPEEPWTEIHNTV